MDAHSEHKARPVSGPTDAQDPPRAHAKLDREEIPPEPSLGTRIGRRAVIGLLLTVVLVPPAAGFYVFITGRPILPAKATEETERDRRNSIPTVRLVEGKGHTVDVPTAVQLALGIRKGDHFVVATAQPPTSMRPLVLSGSTALDPTKLARIKARFAPARVVELAQVHDFSPTTGISDMRELRAGDPVSKGDLLGVFYSVDVSNTKNKLLDALIQLELDQKILDRVEANRDAVPDVFRLQQARAVEGDRNAVNQNLSTLRLWDIPQEEIDELHASAREIAGNQDEWSKTAEGKWVKGAEKATGKVGKSETGKARSEHEKERAEEAREHRKERMGEEKEKSDEERRFARIEKEHEKDWGGRVTLRAPFDGVVIERNVHVDEMVVDNTVNLFQIADVSRLLVIASCPEDAIPALESLSSAERKWTIRTVGVSSSTGLPGRIDEIGYIIDPNQHTAVIKGYVENPGKHLRGGQFISATVNIPPPEDVVEIPLEALVDDGRQSLVFVQPDPKVSQFTLRRIKVTHRFEHSVFASSVPLTGDDRLSAEEAEEGLLPREPLRPGERVILSGAVELKAHIADLEEEQAHLASMKN